MELTPREVDLNLVVSSEFCKVAVDRYFETPFRWLDSAGGILRESVSCIL